MTEDKKYDPDNPDATEMHEASENSDAGDATSNFIDLSRADLEPLPLVRKTPEPEVFCAEALGPLRSAAEALHDQTQAPIAICAQSVLGVATIAAQALFDAETLHGRAPCSQFLLTVAQSGERKSTCDRIVMRPIRHFEQELAEARKVEMIGYRNRREIWEIERKRIIGRKDNRDAREADLEALGAEPLEPLYASIVAAEPTLEGITKNMPMLRASLGIFSDEGGAFLGGHSMSSENRMRTVSGFSSMWDGTAQTRWRAADGIASFAGRRTTMHIMVQPVVALELLSDPLANGQGFLARCLITEPPSAIGSRVRRGHSATSERDLEAFNSRILELLRHALPLRDGTRNELDPPVLPLSEEARVSLEDFALDVEQKQGSGGPLEGVRPFASKAAEHAARLAAVLTVYAGEREVSDGTMSNAIRLTGYYIREAMRLTDAAKVSRGTSNAEKLLRWLQNEWMDSHISVSDALQRGPNSLRTAELIQPAFAVLEQHGYLIPVEGGAMVGGKYRKRAWYIDRATVAD